MDKLSKLKCLQIKSTVLIIFFCTNCLMLFAQIAATNSGGQVKTVQPRIMVVPYVKQGEDIRTILEGDVNKRIAITKIKEAFDSRGFDTDDFIGKLKTSIEGRVIASDKQTDFITQIIQSSNADVYVNAEIIINSNGTKVSFNLDSYETSTGAALSHKTVDNCTSGSWNFSDIGKFSAKAIEACIEDFINVMQMKFNQIVNDGKRIRIDFSLAADSKYKLSTEFDGLPLSDQIEQWMEKNAFKNDYNIQINSETSMIFDVVRIPLKDQSTGKNYNPSKFALEIYSFLKKYGIETSKTSKGNTIYITIK